MSRFTAKIRLRYQKMTDDQILKIAQYEAADLNPTGLEILQEEVKRRGLSSALEVGIKMQEDGISEDELEELKKLIYHSACPDCGEQVDLLGSAIVTEVVSAIAFTSYSQNLVIACPKCLRKRKNKALLKTILLGWWGIPFGVFRTIQAVIEFIQGERKKVEISEQGIQDFALLNIAYLKLNENKPEMIIELMKKNNSYGSIE
ncbi:MAG: hypothetical protein AAF388_13435 [Bacteroidota bacterium]